jgi:hypothetical protein
MAVKVSIPKVVKDAEHKDGTAINIRDNHLIVFSGGSTALAIYAPGSWTSAEVTS